MRKEELNSLVLKAQANDEEAFVDLYKNYYNVIYRTAFKLCKNDADAKDAAQLTFIQIRKSIHTLKDPNFFPLWIHRIVSNKCKNIFRYNHEQLFDNEYFTISNQFVEYKREADAIQNSHFQSDKKVLLQMIHELSKEQQEVLEFTYFKQLSNEESARLLNISVGTVKSRLHTARKNLYKKVTDYEHKEGVFLDFKAEALLGVFLFGFLAKQLSIPLTSLSLPFLEAKAKIRSISTSTISKTALAMISGGVMVVGGAMVFDQMKPQSIQTDLIEHGFQKTSFPQLQAFGITVSNSQDAYYLLRGWAYDEQAMQHKKQRQIQDVLPIYNALKKEGGAYYKLLEDNGWSKNFEKISNF